MSVSDLIGILAHFHPDTPVVGIMQGRYAVAARGVTAIKVPGIDGFLLTLEYDGGSLATCEPEGEG